NEASFGAREGRRKPWWSKVEIHIHGAAPTQTVRLDGRLLPVEWRKELQELVVVTPDLAPGAHLTLSPAP
ncbi:hypothetical protein, partial [Clostridioides difficile]|uniref:hypothetical protein n=1 Tax=Clostridioides difficile TaxID=1496 RepID=UPI001A9AE120